MLILAAGAPRSGSTWLYNAVRLLLTAVGHEPYACWVDDFDPHREASLTLVKIHRADPQWAERADVILTCHRDLRDVVASLEDMGWSHGPDAAAAQAKLIREAHEFWARRAALNLAYRTIVEQPKASVAALAGACGASLPPASVDSVLHDLEELGGTEAFSYDPVTLLHRRHKRDGRQGRWKGQLEASLAARIAGENRSWLETHGYDVA